uniref:Uncharacterized protein n=1 Tax=Bicosoecida sp. CB-2014 TaxID=1486930 RepID=A0A7S1GE64_9STRA
MASLSTVPAPLLRRVEATHVDVSHLPGGEEPLPPPPRLRAVFSESAATAGGSGGAGGDAAREREARAYTEAAFGHDKVWGPEVSSVCVYPPAAAAAPPASRAAADDEDDVPPTIALDIVRAGDAAHDHVVLEVSPTPTADEVVARYLSARAAHPHAGAAAASDTGGGAVALHAVTAPCCSACLEGFACGCVCHDAREARTASLHIEGGAPLSVIGLWGRRWRADSADDVVRVVAHEVTHDDGS